MFSHHFWLDATAARHTKQQLNKNPRIIKIVKTHTNVFKLPHSSFYAKAIFYIINLLPITLSKLQKKIFHKLCSLLPLLTKEN